MALLSLSLTFITVVVLNASSASAAFVAFPLHSAAIRGGHVSSNNNWCKRRSSLVRLWANQQDDSQNDHEDVIFYDDFADAFGGSFVGSASSSSSRSNSVDVPSLPLPDFDAQDEILFQRRPLDSPPDFKSDNIINENSIYDLTGSNTRQFILGTDLLISDYVGSLGFDQVTDWQYYLTTVDEDGNQVDQYQEKIPVQAPFMDPTKPSRTRSKSGSVVRIFRGEFTGRLGGLLRANGIDNRVLLKEYSVDSLELVKREKKMIGQMMSHFLKQEMDTNLLSELQNGKWIDAAQSRYTDSITNTPIKADNEHLQLLLTYLSKYKAPFTSLLGEMNLNAYYDDPNLDSNQWYRSLGVKPPSPGSVWLAYDYHGLSSASSYCIPTLFQVAKLPPKRGVFGNIIQAPPIPPFKERARYVVHGIMKQMLHAVALTHEAGLVHKSLGRNSFLLSSVGQEKREATNPYAVVVDRLRVVLSDWGFAQRVEDVVQEEEFLSRANSFGIDVEYDVEAAMEFAVAEDLHALGFVFLGLLFTTLAEPATLTAPMPLTDDDTWQRLFSELFSKDMDEFREYCSNEEDVWDSVVELLDMEDGAGWSVLGDLLLAREKVVDWSKSVHINEEYKLASARDISNHLFFQMRII